MTIEAVVFDIGNVLIEWNPERFYDGAIGEARRKEMFEALDLHGMNDRVDRGENFTDVVTAFAEENTQWRAEIMMWHDNWLDMTGPVFDQSVRLLRALRRKGVPVFALSNFGIETFDLGREHYPFLEEFDRPYISGHLAMAKPDAEIYAHVERDSGVAPEAMLFADDRPENIAAAKARGWQTHLFDASAGFATRLVHEGLLSADEAT